EAHHQPQHRVFVESLLGYLYKEVYRFLGCETMPYHKDSELNAQKYPVQGTGYYSKQPQFGNMIRAAIDDGYYVFGYEASFKSGEYTPEKREIEQAQHVKAFLDANPDAKFIIYCGYGHLAKSSKKIETMEMRLKEYTGIEPFCIDQTTFTEKGSPEYEDAFYKLIHPEKQWAVPIYRMCMMFAFIIPTPLTNMVGRIGYLQMDVRLFFFGETSHCHSLVWFLPTTKGRTIPKRFPWIL